MTLMDSALGRVSSEAIKDVVGDFVSPLESLPKLTQRTYCHGVGVNHLEELVQYVLWSGWVLWAIRNQPSN